MEYIPGCALNGKLARGPLPEGEVLALAVQLVEGLIAAHDRSIIHRDLKPANLLITNDSRLKILDFGLAKLRLPLTESITQSQLESHSIAGTFPYMAPEQLLGGDLDGRTDLYAAGLILYEMATGQRPFAELPSGKLLDAILHRPPIPPRQLNPKLTSELEQIICKCLEKNPAERYQSAKELAVDLRRVQRGTAGDTLPLSQTVPDRAQSFVNRRTLRSSLAAVLLLSSLAAAFLVLRSRGLLPSFFSGPPRIQSIAVLPLANLSGDPDREFFADGVTEELITQLGKSTGLRVISRQSVMQFKKSALPLNEIARKLGVDAVVEGSVLQSGNRVRVTARLVAASSEKPLWAEQYDRDLRDILTLQAEVTQAIAGEIRLKLSAEEKARLAATAPRESRSVRGLPERTLLLGSGYEIRL